MATIKKGKKATSSTVRKVVKRKKSLKTWTRPDKGSQPYPKERFV